MAKIVKKKIRWQAVQDAGLVGYKVYVAKDGETLNYESPSVSTTALELVIPDDFAVLAGYEGQVSAGVVAVDNNGNESDMRQVDFFSDFQAPLAPASAEVVDL